MKLYAIAALLALSGLSVLVGYGTNNAALESLYLGIPSMRPFCALCFLVSGILLWAMSQEIRHRGSKLCQVMIAGSSLFIINVVLFALWTLVFGRILLAEDFLLGLNNAELTTVIQHTPTLGSGSVFFLFALAGLAVVFNTVNMTRRLKPLGILTIVMSVTAIAGRYLGVPVLYYSFHGLYGMPLISSYLHLISGVALFLLCKEVTKAHG